MPRRHIIPVGIILATTVATAAVYAQSHPGSNDAAGRIPEAARVSDSDQTIHRLSDEAIIIGTVIAGLVAFAGFWGAYAKMLRDRDAAVLAREARFAALRKEFTDAQTTVAQSVSQALSAHKNEALTAIAGHRDEARNDIAHVVRSVEAVALGMNALREEVNGLRAEVAQDMNRVHERIDNIGPWDHCTERRQT